MPSARLVAAAALLAAAPRALGATTLDLRLFDAKAFPKATCNDGTMSGYYFRRSPSNTSTTWIVHQGARPPSRRSPSCLPSRREGLALQRW
jgi:hypothetical protein